MTPEAKELKLALSTKPEYGRVRRFKKGDRVVLSAGKWYETKHTVVDWECDPLQPRGYEHCSGNSARYRLEPDAGPVWDWQLEPTSYTLQERLQQFFTWLLTSPQA